MTGLLITPFLYIRTVVSVHLSLLKPIRFIMLTWFLVFMYGVAATTNNYYQTLQVNEQYVCNIRGNITTAAQSPDYTVTYKELTTNGGCYHVWTIAELVLALVLTEIQALAGHLHHHC